jgi:predicted dehydrogenase
VSAGPTRAADGGEPLRWGALGAARIAERRLIPALRAAGDRVVAIAASRLDRARDFAERNGIDRAFGDYQAALDDPEIDAIYIALANHQHFEWALKTAEAGKACLCEKPLVATAGEAERLAAAFERAGRPLVEAFMWRHHEQVDWVAERLARDVGPLRRMHATFSYALDRPADYRWNPAMGGGALWDVGCYAVNAARRFFGAAPIAGSARSAFGAPPRDVDETTVGWLDFGRGRMATFGCSLRSAFAQGIDLIGERGRIWIERPWLQVDVPARVVVEIQGEATEKVFDASNAYVAMARAFKRIARGCDNPIAGAEATEATENGVAQAGVMEGLVRSAREAGRTWRREGMKDEG